MFCGAQNTKSSGRERQNLKLESMPMAKTKKMSVEHFPKEIIAEILYRLPVKYVIRCSCVSKRWRSIIGDPQFAQSHYKFAAEQQTLIPRLLIYKGHGSKLRSIDLETPSSRVEDRNLTFPFEKQSTSLMVVGSCNGLVCVFDSHEIFYILNPTIGYLKKLPDRGCFNPKIFNHVVNYGFGYVSTTDDYKVVAAQWNGKTLLVFSLKANCWKSIEAPMPFNDQAKRGALSNGALHWLKRTVERNAHPRIVKHTIIAFDLAKEEFREVMLPMFEEDDFNVFGLGVTLEGCLCAQVHWRYDTKWNEIWVMREYDVRKSWAILCKFPTRVANAGVTSRSIFIRESGRALMQNYNHNKKVLICFRNQEDIFDKTVVCTGRYKLEDVWSQDDMIPYVESLLSC